MSVRAKFRYTGYAAAHSTRAINPHLTGREAALPSNHEKVEVRTMSFAPVSPRSDDPDHENRLFWQATPSGELKLQMVNPEAWSQFEMGKCYYLDFTEAPD